MGRNDGTIERRNDGTKERLNDRTKAKPLEAVKRCNIKIPSKLNKTLEVVGEKRLNDGTIER